MTGVGWQRLHDLHNNVTVIKHILANNNNAKPHLCVPAGDRRLLLLRCLILGVVATCVLTSAP